MILALVLVGACESALAPASNALVAKPSETPSPPVSSPDVPSSSPIVSTTPGPTGSDETLPTPTDSFVGSVVATLASDGVRVRSEPSVSDDSLKLEPLLPLGSELYVLEGPVSASGYAWYEVIPLSSRQLPSGWVASADRDGEPWIAPRAFACPPVPTDLRSLAALPRGIGLACFPRVPITVEARLISCNCDVDGSWYTPDWFYLGSGGPDLLVEPAVRTVPPNVADWFALNLDPTGEHPDVLPIGQIVEVTGIFDHPAASSCTRTDMDGEPASSQGCRLEFAVTRLLVSGP
jgi:hypothetical protein